MSYRGRSILDSGYFYMPYVPLTQTPVVGERMLRSRIQDSDRTWMAINNWRMSERNDLPYEKVNWARDGF